jgi:glycosyltransferase involved in cell wall biosynthesis
MIDLSVVIPVRNEEASVGKLHRELTDVLVAFGRAYEILVVDDGSTDRTFQLLGELQAVDSHLRVIQLRRNFGQTAAFAAGFDHARGRYIVTMDGDLQNDPHDIPEMIARIERGADVVCGWRKDRKDPFLSRRLPSMTANAIISSVTGVHLHDYGCSLKVFRSEIIKPMKLYGEMHRFLPAIASEQTSRVEEQVVNHRKREHGRSNYGIGRTIRVVLDLLTVKFLLAYATRPLQIFGLIGVAMGTVGGAITAWLAYERLREVTSLNQHLPMLLLGILLVTTGLQLVTVGLLAELQARTYHESQDKPTYVVKQILEEPSSLIEAASPIRRHRDVRG